MFGTRKTLIVPLAHYVGVQHTGDGQPPTYGLRGGWDFVTLTADECAVWIHAHGVPERLTTGEKWTRKALLDSVRSQVPDADPIIDRFLADGILMEVTPGTKGAVEFAKKVRLVPLQPGHGNTAAEPWSYGIGSIGGQPLVEVSHTVYNAWEWSHLYENLWASCTRLASIRAKNASVPASKDDTDPERILTEVIEALHALLASSCAYVDVPAEVGKG